MTAAESMSVSLHGAFDPVWSASRQLKEGRSAPSRNPQSTGSKKSMLQRPSDFSNPGGKELRSALVRANAVLFRTKVGQFYEKATKVVHAEQHPPPAGTAGDWFPDASQVYVCLRKSVDTQKVNHFFDIVDKMPFLFKALDRIKLSWLRNTYPLPPRIVRALGRDDFEFISVNLPTPLAEMNRYPGAMWIIEREGAKQEEKRDTPNCAHERRHNSRPYNRSGSRSLNAGSLAPTYDPSAVGKSAIAHRKPWNQLVHHYMDDCGLARQRKRLVSTRVVATGQSADVDQLVLGSRHASPSEGNGGAGTGSEREEPAAHPEQPATLLIDTLYPPWQLVEELERGERRVSNLHTSSAEDAQSILERCRELRDQTLDKMEEEYNAKIHKVEDNTLKRYRRKVSYLVPPYRTVGIDMPVIRRRVQQRALKEDVVVRYSSWYSRLFNLATAIGATELPRFRETFDHLQPFSRLEGSSTSHGKEKLCLLMMSLPFYEALDSELQMAVFFIHVHFLGGSEKVFRLWLTSRSLIDETLTSPLLKYFRDGDPTSSARKHH